MGTTFLLTVLAWVFFRSESIGVAINFISNIFSSNLLKVPDFSGKFLAAQTMLMILLIALIEWLYLRQNIIIKFKKNWITSMFYYFLVFALLYFGNYGTNEFIYFQF